MRSGVRMGRRREETKGTPRADARWHWQGRRTCAPTATGFAFSSTPALLPPIAHVVVDEALPLVFQALTAEASVGWLLHAAYGASPIGGASVSVRVARSRRQLLFRPLPVLL